MITLKITVFLSATGNVISQRTIVHCRIWTIDAKVMSERETWVQIFLKLFCIQCFEILLGNVENYDKKNE